LFLPKEIYQALLLGTEKAGGNLRKVVGDAGTVEAATLEWLVRNNLKQKAGFVPKTEAQQLPKDDIGLNEHTELALLLTKLVNHRYADALTTNTVQLLVENQKKWPAALLPDLLGWAKPRPAMHSIVRQVVGSRGVWLARLNPEWAYISTNPSEENWEISSFTDRLFIVKKLRNESSSKAYQLVISTFDQDDTTGKSLLLSTLKSPELKYFGFLEECLKHRSKEVRKQAGLLLLKSIQSQLSKDVQKAALQIVSISGGGILTNKKMSLKFPTEKIDWDEFLPIASMGKQSIQEILLTRLVAALPIDFWLNHFQLEFSVLLKFIEKTDYTEAFTQGFFASMRLFEQDQFLMPLVEFYHKTRKPANKISADYKYLISVCDETIFQQVFKLLLNSEGAIGLDGGLLRDAIDTNERIWSVENTEKLMEMLKTELSKSNPYHLWSLKTIFKSAAMSVPFQKYDKMNLFWSEMEKYPHFQLELTDFLSVLHLRNLVGKLILN
jgi:Family of unknown function (DUF5691)